MPTRAQACAWIAVCALVLPSAAPAQDRTAAEVVDLIVRDGPQARAIRVRTEVTRREQRARLAWSNPAATYSREGAGFTEFLQVEQSLPWFGGRASLSLAGLSAAAAAEAERDAHLWTLRSEAASAVARLIAEQERLETAEAQLRQVEQLIEVLRAREREGEGSRFDRLRAEQELGDARQGVTAAAVRMAAGRAALLAMLPAGVPLGRIADPTGEERPLPPLESLIARALAARADARALRHEADRADREGDGARAARRPAPTIFGGFKRTDDALGGERGGVIGLSVSVPLFDTGGREAAVWTAERARIDEERLALEAQIRAEVIGAAESLTLRRRAVVEGQAFAGDELARIAEVAYREGEVGILELLDAVRTVWRARFRSIDLELESRLAQIALQRVLGDVVWP